MIDNFIPQMMPLFGEEEKIAMAKYMDEGGFLTEFKRTTIFENMIAEYTGSKHCIVVNNGTISLTLAAIACGIKHGDEVIVPNYTMVATPNSVSMIGAKPIFVDVDSDTLSINLEEVKNAITNKTKAIMYVSSNGRYPPYEIELLSNLAKENDIALIEDAAQSLGSFNPNGDHIGREGSVGSFSFSAPKIISTGQGGALITDDDEIAFKIRRLKDFGRSGGGNDIHDSIGFNFKFTELQACIGIEQMKKLSSRVERKKEIYNLYKEGLKNIQGISLFHNDVKYTAPWFYDSLVENREELMKYLKSKNIGTRVMYPPINKQLAYNEDSFFTVSEKIGHKGLWLPSAVQLKDSEIEYIAKSIAEFYST